MNNITIKILEQRKFQNTKVTIYNDICLSELHNNKLIANLKAFQ